MSTAKQVRDVASVVAASASALIAVEALNRQWARPGDRNWFKLMRRAMSLTAAGASAYGAYKSLRRDSSTADA